MARVPRSVSLGRTADARLRSRAGGSAVKGVRSPGSLLRRRLRSEQLALCLRLTRWRFELTEGATHGAGPVVESAHAI